jgi:hypothetical protein
MVPLLNTNPVISSKMQLIKQNRNPVLIEGVRLTYLTSSPVTERRTPNPAPKPMRILNIGPAKQA